MRAFFPHRRGPVNGAQLKAGPRSAKTAAMTDRLIIALAQVNPTLGAISANLARAREVLREAPEADLILFPELFICGYPPEDLVLRSSFVEACTQAVEDLAKDTASGPAVLIGLPWRITVGPRGLANGVVELTSRRTGESVEMSPEAAVARIAEIYEGI